MEGIKSAALEGVSNWAGSTDQIIQAKELNHATAMGWKLVSVITRKAVEIQPASLPVEYIGPHGTNKTFETRHCGFPVEEILCHVSRDPEAAKVDFMERLGAKEKELIDARRDAHGMKGDLAKVRDDLEGKESELGGMREAQRLLSNSLNEKSDLVRRYEADMAKLWKEFGEARVREVLKPEEAK